MQRGAYIAQLGDCAACHTAPGGFSMAGGREMSTPFGALYSTNITPDPQSGIGGYSFEQFDRAVRLGVAADGKRLYPAMPYPSFAKIRPPDMRALYAYFMQAVKPVRQENRANDLHFPFNLRFGLLFWDLAFADERPYAPDPAHSAQWNRGAYLVEGLGHCGTCHTPRGIGFQEKAMSPQGDGGAEYLAGSTIEGWHAPSLRRLWPAREIVDFLRTGRNHHAAAYGSMAEVVHFSTQHFDDEDLDAVSEFFASLGTAAPAPGRAARAQDAGLYTTRGGLGYVQFCSSCHRTDGSGIAGLFPPLAENSSIDSLDPSSVVHVVLGGGKSAQTQRFPRAFAMPSFAELGDQELAEILSFVRTSWSNGGAAVQAQDVQAMRAQLPAASAEETAKFSTPRFASLLERPDAARLIRGLRLMSETGVLLPHNVGDRLACSSCHLNAGTVARASPYVGVAALFPMYQARAGMRIDFKDRINGCLRRSMNGHALDKTSPDMEAMSAFAAWMKTDAKPDAIPGRGLGRISRELVPDARNGKEIYKNQCAACHGDDGQGLRAQDGTQLVPPLWGKDSFNIGAGMARTYTAAAFLKNNMPVANTLKFPLGQGGLGDQEALDVAEYFTHMPRPDFPDKVKDWPKGGKPKDARY